MIRKWLILMVCILGFCLSITAEETQKFNPMDLTSEQFLQAVRRAPGRESWALMTGTATHRRDGFRTIR